MFRLLRCCFLMTTTTGSVVPMFHQTTNHNLPNGLHISVKADNQNLVSQIADWNQINNRYEDFLQKNPNNLITIPFQDWNQIINSYQPDNKIADQFSAQVITAFKQQISKPANQILKNPTAIKNFATNALGRSVAINYPNNEISSFGFTYLPYHVSEQAKVHNGLLALINEASQYQNNFAIPYTITPSQQILNQAISERLKIFNIGDSEWDKKNERTVVIFAKNAGESLQITNNKNAADIKIINQTNLAYAILNYDAQIPFNENKFIIDAYDDKQQLAVTKTVQLTNTTSDINFDCQKTTTDAPSAVLHQYLIQTNTNQVVNNLLVMNEVQKQATISFDPNAKWNRYLVDPKTLKMIKESGVAVQPGTKYQLDEQEDYKIYLFEKLNQANLPISDSAQYLILYQNQIPRFLNCSDLNQMQNTVLKHYLQRYLFATNQTVNLATLMANPSNFIRQFINFQTDTLNHYYVNYAGIKDEQPWDLQQSLKTVTLVNHWGIVIIFIFVTLIFLLVPVIIYLIRIRNRIK